jgi:hypothetical protein
VDEVVGTHRWRGPCRPGLNATPGTQPVWPGERLAELAVAGRVPEPNCAVHAGADEGLAVRAERHPEREMVPVSSWPTSIVCRTTPWMSGPGWLRPSPGRTGAGAARV